MIRIENNEFINMTAELAYLTGILTGIAMRPHDFSVEAAREASRLSRKMFERCQEIFDNSLEAKDGAQKEVRQESGAGAGGGTTPQAVDS